MSWGVRWTKPAAKDILGIPKKQRLMILAWVEENLNGCDNPRSVHGGKQLRGTDCGWRWRVGSYRILGRLNDGSIEIEVVRVGHRQGVYNNLPKL